MDSIGHVKVGVTPAAPNIPYFTPEHPELPGTPHNVDSNTPTLFTPLTIRGVTLRNRVVVAPMCQFSTSAFPPQVGQLTDYHVVTLGQYALKGAALVYIEATGVQPNGRITPNCPGLWEDAQIAGVKRVADFIKSQGALCGIQLGHAGRKACTVAPWVAMNLDVARARADESIGGWPADVVGVMGGPEYAWDGNAMEGGCWPPRQLSPKEIKEIIVAFADSAKRAVAAGVDVIEVHAAHGYLISSFMSPITNQRTDQYGGSYKNRTRLLIEVIQAIRLVVPKSMPLFIRISATEWMDETELGKKYGSWTVDDTIRLAKLLPDLGVDLLDISSGGNHPLQKINMFDSKDYQTKISSRVRQEIHKAHLKLLIGAVGLITEAEQARDIVEMNKASNIDVEAMAAIGVTDSRGEKQPMADVILVGRQFLREPHWVLKIASNLGVDVAWPIQFAKAKRKFI